MRCTSVRSGAAARRIGCAALPGMAAPACGAGPFPAASDAPPSAKSKEAAMWEPSLRYPDPAIVLLDPSFARFRVLGGVERLAEGCRWAEGPVWFGDGRCLLWSDIPN